MLHDACFMDSCRFIFLFRSDAYRDTFVGDVL